MSNTALAPLSAFLNEDGMQKSIQNTLRDRTPQFIASVISLVNTNPKLAECERMSLINACMTASVLDLPINQNLGYAYIVPYDKSFKVVERNTTGREVEVWKKEKLAQFQMGWKGFVQLAMRTGLYSRINTRDVRAGEFLEEDFLSGDIKFEFLKEKRDTAPIIGYVAYFKLKKGFEKVHYMTVDEIKKHGVKYSKSFANDKGQWAENPDAMSRKTVLKLLLSKFGPMSSELAKAITDDQAVIDENGVNYVDNKPDSSDAIAKDKELARIKTCIDSSTKIEELEQCKQAVLDWNDADLIDMYQEKAQTFEVKE